jgi:hypothetical protein
MTVPEDGIYEVEDLFYADGGFTVKVSGDETGGSSGNAFTLNQKTPEPPKIISKQRKSRINSINRE